MHEIKNPKSEILNKSKIPDSTVFYVLFRNLTLLAPFFSPKTPTFAMTITEKVFSLHVC